MSMCNCYINIRSSCRSIHNIYTPPLGLKGWGNILHATLPPWPRPNITVYNLSNIIIKARWDIYIGNQLIINNNWSPRNRPSNPDHHPRGLPLEYCGGGGWIFGEINIVVGEMAETNKWPQLRHGGNTTYSKVNKNIVFQCEINKNGQAEIPATPDI